MDSTDAWHSGALCLRPRWAARVDLLPNELLSSWIARSAMANGCDPSSLTSAIWPKSRWGAFDIDRSPGAERLEAFSRQGGIQVDALHLSTLRPIAAIIYNGVNLPNGNWPWITSVRPRTGPAAKSVAFCPACLARDESPFLRMQWRFAWITACPLHGVALIDRCPSCSGAPQPDRNGAESSGLARCIQCRSDLSRGVHQARVESNVFWLQKETDRVLATGGGNALGHHLSLPKWFRLMALCVRMVQSAIRAPWNPFSRALRSLSAQLPIRPTERRLENALVTERKAVLSAVARLMQVERMELTMVFVDAGVSRQNLALKCSDSDHPFHFMAEVLPDRSRLPRRKSTPRVLPEPKSRVQVKWKMHRLLAFREVPPKPVK